MPKPMRMRSVCASFSWNRPTPWSEKLRAMASGRLPVDRAVRPDRDYLQGLLPLDARRLASLDAQLALHGKDQAAAVHFIAHLVHERAHHQDAPAAGEQHLRIVAQAAG